MKSSRVTLMPRQLLDRMLGTQRPTKQRLIGGRCSGCTRRQTRSLSNQRERRGARVEGECLIHKSGIVVRGARVEGVCT